MDAVNLSCNKSVVQASSSHSFPDIRRCLPIGFGSQNLAIRSAYRSQGSRAAVGRTLDDPDQSADILVQREWAES